MTSRNDSPTSIEAIWKRYDETEARLSARLSERMIELAQLRPGLRVLDLATGRGEPAIRAAHRVGPSGFVLGIDLAASMLEMTRSRASAEGVGAQLQLLVGDAQDLSFVRETDFDVAFNRWALMYFQDPVRSLVEAKSKLKQLGKIVVAIWAEPDRVEYFTLPRQVLARYQAIPAIDYNLPSPFQLSSVDKISSTFSKAGFSIESIEEQYVEVMEADSDEELVRWCRAFGLNRLMGDLPEEKQLAWERDLAVAARPFYKDGFFRLGGITRIVVAKPME